VSADAEGQELLGHAERLMRLRAEMIEAGRRSFHHARDRAARLSETIVHTCWPTLIERVNTAYPNLELEIRSRHLAQSAARLVARDLDARAAARADQRSEHPQPPVCCYPLAFVAGSKVRLPNKPLAPEAIAKWPIVSFRATPTLNIVVRELFTRAACR